MLNNLILNLQRDCKKPLIFILILLFISVSFTYLFSGHERAWWYIWNIPASPPHFNDVDMMTMGAESHAMGHDPLYNNPVHPWNKKLNYPRIWHLLYYFDMNRSHNNLIGSISVLIFYVGLGIFLFSKQYNKLTIFLISLIVLSPSIALGIERGNIELIIFCILSFALILNYSSSFAALFVFLFASLLKIYPAITFIYLLKEKEKKFWTLFLSASGIFIIYALLILADLQQIFLTTPKIAKSSYGLNVLWMGLTHPKILNMQISDEIIMTVRFLSYIMLATIFITAIALSIRKSSREKYEQGQHIDAFRVGASIYIGCFILGNNFDYRFTFLIFVIPQLVSWLYSNKFNYLSAPFITVCAIIFSCWNYTLKRFTGVELGFLLEEMSNWIILSCMLFLFLASSPVWFSDYFRKPLSYINSIRKKTEAN